MERDLQRAPLEVGHRRQHAGEEALHIGGAAAIEPAAALDETERIAVPALAIDRHHVGMSRQRNAGDALGADGGEQARLLAILGRHQLAGDAVPREVVGDEADERAIGIAAGGVERDEPFQYLGRSGRRSGHEASSFAASDSAPRSRPDAAVGCVATAAVQFMLRSVNGLSSENAGTATSNNSPPRPTIW